MPPMDKNKLTRILFRAGDISFYVAVALSIGFLLILFSDIGDTALHWMYTSSDKQYASVIFRDLFLDGTGISGWHLNAAPNFFPDMFFYFILMSVFREVTVTDFVFSMLQYTGFLFLVYGLFRQLNRQWSGHFAALFVFLMFFYLLIPVYTERFLITFQFISISYHFGSVIMSLVAFNLLLLWFRTGRALAWLCLVVVLGTVSDRLFLVQFVFPVLPLAALLFRKSHRGKLIVPLIAVAVSTVAGLLLFRAIKLSKAITIIGTGFKMFNFENIRGSWDALVSHMTGIFRAYHAERGFLVIAMLAFAASLVFLLPRLKKLFRGEIPEERLPAHYMIIIMTLFMPVVFFMPVINGAYLGPAIIRFNIMGIAMGVILLPLLLMEWDPLNRYLRKILGYLLPGTGLVFMVLLLVRLANADFVRGMDNYFNYYPKRAQVLDVLKDSHGLECGIGGYWQAKKTMMYSRNGVRLYNATDEHFKPWYHTMNENWYHAGGKGRYKDPVFNYISLDGYKDTDKLKEVFGNRIDTIYNDGDIMIAKVPEFRFERGSREIVLLTDREKAHDPLPQTQ